MPKAPKPKKWEHKHPGKPFPQSTQWMPADNKELETLMLSGVGGYISHNGGVKLGLKRLIKDNRLYIANRYCAIFKTSTHPEFQVSFLETREKLDTLLETSMRLGLTPAYIEDPDGNEIVFEVEKKAKEVENDGSDN